MRMQKNWNPHVCSREYKLVRLFREAFGWWLPKLNIYLTYDLAVLLLGIFIFYSLEITLKLRK